MSRNELEAGRSLADVAAAVVATAALAAVAVRAAPAIVRSRSQMATDTVSPEGGGSTTADDAEAPTPTGRVAEVVDVVDAFQRRVPPLAFALGVAKKFGEDRAGRLAALISYYSFFSVFPLLLALVTVLGFVLEGNPSLREDIVDSALAQFPVVGGQISRNVDSLQGNYLALAVGLGGAIWAGMGAMLAGQQAMDDIWDVPLKDRPNFVKKRIRAVLMLGVLGLGIGASVAVSNLASHLPDLPGIGRLALNLGSLAISVAVVGLAFQVLTDRHLSWNELVPGAVIGGVGYFVLQLLGSLVVTNAIQGAEDTYGTFAVVIGLLTWFFILGQVTLLGVEVNVVWSRRLWPRSLSGRNLTPADRQAIEAEALQSARHDGVAVQAPGRGPRDPS